MPPRPELVDPSLLAAVIASPDDDAPRLVYADFLESKGATHDAEIVRRQLALSAGDPYGFDALFALARDLDVVSGRRSERPRPSLPAGLEWPPFSFERGFPSRLLVRDLDALLSHGERIAAETPLTSLEIDMRAGPSLERLARTPWLRRIRRVRFSLGRSGRDRLAPLLASPHVGALRELELAFEGVDGSGVSALIESELARRLERLALDSDFFVERGEPLRSAFRAPEPLGWRALSLRGNRIEASLLATLAAQVALPRLEILELSDNPVGAAFLSALGPWLDSKGVARLGLAKAQLGLEGARALADAGHFIPRLRSLSLDGNRLGPNAVKALAGAPVCRSIEHLGLGDNPVGDHGAELLAASAVLERLVSLDLTGCKVGERGLRALLESPHLRALRILDAYSPGVTVADEGLRRALEERFGLIVPSAPS